MVITDPYADFVINSPVPISFQRSYISSMVREAPLGLGWTHNYELKLYEVFDGVTIVYFQGSDNRYHRYYRDDNNIVSYRDDGSRMTLDEATYKLELRSGHVYKFNSSKNIESIEDKKGRSIEFTYTSGKLTRIEDGDALYGATITYDGNTIDTIAAGGVTFTYNYTSNRLTSVSKGVDTTIQYGYTLLTIDGDTFWKLMDIKDPDGNIIEHHEYDAYGRADSVITQNGNYTVTYPSTNSTNSGPRTVKREDLGIEQDKYLNSDRKLTYSTNNLGCSGCGESAGASKYIRDLYGRNIATTSFLQDGTSVHHMNARDGYGNLTFKTLISPPIYGSTYVHNQDSFTIDDFSNPWLDPLTWDVVQVGPNGHMEMHETGGSYDGITLKVGKKDILHNQYHENETAITGITSRKTFKLTSDSAWYVTLEFDDLDTNTSHEGCYAGVMLVATQKSLDKRIYLGAGYRHPSGGSSADKFFRIRASRYQSDRVWERDEWNYENRASSQSGKVRFYYNSNSKMVAEYHDGSSWQTIGSTNQSWAGVGGVEIDVIAGNLCSDSTSTGSTVVATAESVYVTDPSTGSDAKIVRYDYSVKNDEPAYLYSYITDSDTLPRNTLAKTETLQGSTILKSVDYDYDAPGDWDTDYNEAPTVNLGRIITVATADTDDDGDIGDEGSDTTYYKCFKYDGNNLMTREWPQSSSPSCDDGHSVVYIYDTKRLNTVTRTPEDGSTLVTTYSNWDSFGNARNVNDGNALTTLVFDHLGRTLSRTINGNVTSYEYLGADLEKVTYPEDDYMLYNYTSVLYGVTLHKLSKVEHKNSSDTLIESIAYGYTVVNNTLKTTEEIKDSGGSQKRIKITVEGYETYDGSTVHYTQTTHGSTQVAGHSKVTVKTYYDSSNQPIARVENPGSAKTTLYFYDEEGRLKEVENALGYSTTYKYDFLSNLIGTTVDPDTLDIETDYFYDDFGRLIKTTSPDANTTIYSYNPDGSLDQKQIGCSGASCERTIEYTYDEIGRLIDVDYNYDGAGGLMNEKYVYDGEAVFTSWGGTTLSVGTRGGANSKGRLTSSAVKVWKGGNYAAYGITSFNYTADGLVADKLYQMRVKESSDAGFDEDVYSPYEYDYNDNGVMEQIKYASSGRYVYYCLDGTDPNKPHEVRTGTSSFASCTGGTLTADNITYYPFGDVKQIELGDGQIQKFQRDKRYALDGFTVGTSGDPDAYHEIDYTYDAFGNITGIDDEQNGSTQYPDHVLSYDNLHQLTDATLTIGGSTYHPTYTYNAAGNRASRAEGGSTETYAYTNNRLTGITGGATINFTYNNLGHLNIVEEIIDGATIYAGATYSPNGFIYGKVDWLEDGPSPVNVGDTVISYFSPSGNMILKFNASLVEFKVFGYGLSGNLLETALHSTSETDDPIIDHVYLGNHLIASVTGSGDACFIATVALGTPLASELNVFKAFRDRVLKRFDLGRDVVGWYYDKGPRVAEWIKTHDGWRLGTRIALSVLVVPLRVALFGHLAVIFIIFVLSILTLAIARKLGKKWSASIASGFGVALLLVIGYSYLINVPKAHAAYSQLGTYYYTSDHIGRPFNVREGTTLTWYEQHYPFGEVINEEVLYAMTAGAGDYAISWKPHFRFPGQYEDSDMGTAANSRPLFVQNHYREYMPRFGRYNRVDPLNDKYFSLRSFPKLERAFINPRFGIPFIPVHEDFSYKYTKGNPINRSDFLGLRSCKPHVCEGDCKMYYDGCKNNPELHRCDIMWGLCHNWCGDCDRLTWRAPHRTNPDINVILHCTYRPSGSRHHKICPVGCLRLAPYIFLGTSGGENECTDVPCKCCD